MQRNFLLLICFLAANATAMGQQIDSYGFGAPLIPPRELSITTIQSLSLQGDDNSPALVLRIYRLLPHLENSPRPSADELIPVVRDLCDAPSWQVEGAYLRAINNRLIVRQRADVHRQLRALLDELQLLEHDSLTR